MISQNSNFFKKQLKTSMSLIVLILVTLTFLSACTKKSVQGAEVMFSETEQEAPEQVTRMLVTKNYLRIDEGKDNNDFLLYDRVKRVIYSTNSTDKRTLVVHAQPLTRKSPIKLGNKVKTIHTDAPTIGGNKVKHLNLLTNNEICYDLFAAEGLLPQVVTALKEYRVALSGEQAAIIDAMPKDMLQPCDLANNVFMSTRHLDHGFPVRLQETKGRFRELVSYRQGINIDEALLKLPEGYSEFTAEDMRNGQGG